MSDDDKELMIFAAIRHGYNTQILAALFGRDESTIRRQILSQVESKSVVKKSSYAYAEVPSPDFIKGLDSDLAHFIVKPQAIEKLKAISHGKVLRSIFVSPLVGNSKRCITTEAFYEFHAANLVELISNSKIVYCAAGRTLRDLALSLETSSRSPRQEIDVLPIIGEVPVDLSNEKRPEEISASSIASILARTFTGNRGPSASLVSTPRIIPDKIARNDTKRQTILEFVETDPNYCKVFSKKGLRCESQEGPVVLLGSAGVFGNGRLWSKGVLHSIDEDRGIKDHYCGDVAGVPIPNDFRHDPLQRNFIGLNLQHLEAIAKPTPNVSIDFESEFLHKGRVVIVAFGEEKAAPIFRAITECSIINHLFIDIALFEALKKLMNQRPTSKRPLRR